MQYELQIFHDENQQEFRTVEIDGDPWFVLTDVCRSLDYKTKDGSYWHIAQRLDADERKTIAKSIINGGPLPRRRGGLNVPGASLICVNESGLFSLIISSDKPEAKRFKKWVTSEVLPAIRRRGSYSTGTKPIEAKWQPFHDRITTAWSAVPEGYFSIFREMADIVAQLITQGVPVDHKTIPDIALGAAWAKEWAARGYEHEYGPRITYPHHYPRSFPQHKSNPQWPNCYPDEALAVFRRWVRYVFLPDHLPGYLDRKSTKGDIPPAVAKAALKALGVSPVGKLARR